MQQKFSYYFRKINTVACENGLSKQLGKLMFKIRSMKVQKDANQPFEMSSNC